MNKIEKINVINYGTAIARLGMGAGCGLFVRAITKQLCQGAGTFKKVGIWTGALCTAWALGHAVDCYYDKAWKILTGIIEATEESNETANEE